MCPFYLCDNRAKQHIAFTAHTECFHAILFAITDTALIMYESIRMFFPFLHIYSLSSLLSLSPLSLSRLVLISSLSPHPPKIAQTACFSTFLSTLIFSWLLTIEPWEAFGNDENNSRRQSERGGRLIFSLKFTDTCLLSTIFDQLSTASGRRTYIDKYNSDGNCEY